MVIFSSYKLKELIEDAVVVFIVVNTMACLPCPVCRGELSGFGKRRRIFIDTDNSKKTLLIRRLRCASCGKIHHELPDILVPYKRHCAETIEDIINNEAEVAEYEESTVYRIRAWWRGLLVYIHGVLGSLKAKYGVAFSNPLKPKEVVRALANAHLYVATRSACTSG